MTAWSCKKITIWQGKLINKEIHSIEGKKGRKMKMTVE